jgi:catechol 2,3-dioxygenase-like lactoylglutathione lyase family enzyme
MEAAMSLIKILDHINVQVPPDVEAEAKRFYGQVLGMKEIIKPDNLGRRGAHYKVSEDGSQELHLGIANAEDAVNNRHLQRHIGFQVHDLQAARQAVEDAGFDIEDAEAVRSEARNFTLKRFFVRDPGGNRLEIMECR